MIYVIVGPTGSGKTNLACQISGRYNMPIVNADAFQIYREMNIGTAKISRDDPLYNSHYLIDLIDPSQNYSVKQYRDDFDRVVPNLLLFNKNLIICGGTGLYLRAALYDYTFPEEQEFDESKYDKYSNDELYDMLLKLDPQSCEKIHKNNRKRVIRALAFIENNKLSKSENISSQEHKMRFNNVKILFLNPDRERLYNRINNRVDEMFENGLVEEVEGLLNKYQLSQTASQAIGYKEVIDYLNGLTSLDDCKELIKQRSRNYAKRQITFFKHQFETIEFSTGHDLYHYLIENIENG